MKKAFIVLFGPPGVGKGTQAVVLSERLDYEHVSTGDILREAVKDRTEKGLQIRDFMNRGELVPDSLVNSAVIEKIDKSKSAKGFIFDGFPRNLGQAKEFDKILKSSGNSLDVVINIELDREILLRRIMGRRICSKCSSTFNVELDNIPGDGSCSCGGKLVVRSDDNESVITERFRVYADLTEPLLKYYNERDILRNVDGSGTVAEIASRIKALC